MRTTFLQDLSQPRAAGDRDAGGDLQTKSQVSCAASSAVAPS